MLLLQQQPFAVAAEIFEVFCLSLFFVVERRLFTVSAFVSVSSGPSSIPPAPAAPAAAPAAAAAAAAAADGAPFSFFDLDVSLDNFQRLCLSRIITKAKKTTAKAHLAFWLSPSIHLKVSIYILCKSEGSPPVRRRLKAAACNQQQTSGVYTPQYLPLYSHRFFYRADDPEKKPISLPSKRPAAAAAAAAADAADVAAAADDDDNDAAAAAAAADDDDVAFAFPCGGQLVPVSAFDLQTFLKLCLSIIVVHSTILLFSSKGIGRRLPYSIFPVVFKTLTKVLLLSSIKTSPLLTGILKGSIYLKVINFILL